ncbi:hypothetical protein L596_009337 [Steinernema carpocapsae]|nr:hypothetical protein L596_009337 [Steinernema carpocapsae]
MAPRPSSSSTRDTVDALIYGHIKRKNPCLLLEMFSMEKCRALESNDHNLKPDLLKTMWKNYRIQKRNAPKPNPKLDATKNLPEPKEERKESWKTDWMHGRFCRLKDPTKRVDLAIFHHFKAKLDFKALEELFDEDTSKEYEKLVEKIDVPRIERMLALHLLEALKPENRKHVMIFKCRLCKKDIKETGKALERHIGVHEDIPSYCFIEECDKHFRSYMALNVHIIRDHDLRAPEMNSTQYYRLQVAKMEYSRKASDFSDRYFPPESFVRFDDRKKKDVQKLEDPTCHECGEFIRDPRSRRSHVATHLGLTAKCVVEDCDSVLSHASLQTSHLTNVHKRKVNSLSEKELYAHKKRKVEFNKQMKEEVPKFFPIRTALKEESD